MHPLSLALAALLTAAGSAQALTVTDTPDFSGGSTFIDFDDYSGQSAPLVLSGMTVTAGSVSSSGNWGPLRPDGVADLKSNGTSFVFDAPVYTLSFLFGGNMDNFVDVAFFRDGSEIGDAQLTNDASEEPWVTYAFTDELGFDEVVFARESSRNWTYGLDQVEFTSTSAAVPAPATLPLLAAALGAAGLGLRRRKAA